MSRSIIAMLFLVLIAAPYIIMAKPAFTLVVADEDTWAAKTPMQQARAGLGVEAVNGKIYAIGGSTASGSYPPDAFEGSYVGTNEEYDPTTDTWTPKTSMPTPRAYFAIATLQNKIYCIGGAIGFSVDERTGFYSYIKSDVNEVYDTETNTWETKKPLPFAELNIKAQVLNGKIYVVGGASTYVYDPTNDTWELKQKAPVSHPWPVIVDNKIFVTGEFSTLYGPVEQKLLAYDPKIDKWSERGSGSSAIVEGAVGATTGVKAPQKIYVLGLRVEAPLPTLVNQVYNLETDTWATAITSTVTRSDFGVAVINDIFFVIGGYLRSSSHVTPTAVNEQYTPIGYNATPEIKIISPMNQPYNESSVSLIFTVDEQVSGMSYSLDGKENITVNGNTTLSGLSNGSHNITAYAKDQFGNTGVSETISFSVEVPFPTTLVIAPVVSVVVVAAGLTIYFKKRKH